MDAEFKRSRIVPSLSGWGHQNRGAGGGSGGSGGSSPQNRACLPSKNKVSLLHGREELVAVTLEIFLLFSHSVCTSSPTNTLSFWTDY